jgi:hypothetical protein
MGPGLRLAAQLVSASYAASQTLHKTLRAFLRNPAVANKQSFVAMLVLCSGRREASGIASGLTSELRPRPHARNAVR